MNLNTAWAVNKKLMYAIQLPCTPAGWNKPIYDFGHPSLKVFWDAKIQYLDCEISFTLSIYTWPNNIALFGLLNGESITIL